MDKRQSQNTVSVNPSFEENSLLNINDDHVLAAQDLPASPLRRLTGWGFGLAPSC